MADTGATLVVLTYEDAERLGHSPRSLEFSGIAQTANGVARMAPVTLDRVRVEDITVRDVPAAVAENHRPSRHELLGAPQELPDARPRARPGAIARPLSPVGSE
jgi:clan AA aspartic protease (TIGR02281 family)